MHIHLALNEDNICLLFQFQFVNSFYASFYIAFYQKDLELLRQVSELAICVPLAFFNFSGFCLINSMCVMLLGENVKCRTSDTVVRYLRHDFSFMTAFKQFQSSIITFSQTRLCLNCADPINQSSRVIIKDTAMSITRSIRLYTFQSHATAQWLWYQHLMFLIDL